MSGRRELRRRIRLLLPPHPFTMPPMRRRWLIGPALFAATFAVAASPACGGSTGSTGSGEDAGASSAEGAAPSASTAPTSTSQPSGRDATAPDVALIPIDASTDAGTVTLPCVDGGSCLPAPASSCTSPYELVTYAPVNASCVQGACIYEGTGFDCQSQGGAICITAGDGGAACQMVTLK